MAFDLALLKEHPYATGGVVIVGGIVVFYLLSSSQSSGGTTGASGTSSSDYAAALSADAQLAQTQAAASVQTNAQQVQLQQQQLEAQVANNQTAASLQSTNVQTAAQLAATLAQISGQTTQSANQYAYAENIQAMQDQVLMSQINSGVVENANNNATALAGLQSTNDLQYGIAGLQAEVANTGVQAAQAVQTQQLSEQYDLSHQTLNMVQQAGLNHGTQSLETSLVGVVGSALNQPQVATAAVQSNATAAAASSAATANIINSITGGLTHVASGLLA